MKKVLSFVLVLAMLLCMIPVATVMAADVEPENTLTYDDLYAQSLVASFDVANIDLAAGKWYATVKNAQGKFVKSNDVYATISGGVYNETSNPTGWQVDADGSIFYTDPGYTASANKITFPTSLLSPNFTVVSDQKITLRTLPRDSKTVPGGEPAAAEEGFHTFTVGGFTAWNSGSIRETPTVKYSGPVGTTFTPEIAYIEGTQYGGTGTPTGVEEVTLDENGEATATYGGMGSGKMTIKVPDTVTVVEVTRGDYSSNNEAVAHGAVAIGDVWVTLWTNLTGTNSWDNGKGLSRWYFGTDSWAKHSGNGTDSRYGGRIGSDGYTFNGTNGQRETMMVIRESKVDGWQTATVYINGKSAVTGSTSKTSAMADNTFQLFANVPSQVWGVKVYNSAISATELGLNHFVDLMKEFGVPASSCAGISKMALAAAAVPFANKTAAETTKSAIEDAIAAAPVDIATDYDALYVGANGEKTQNGGKMIGSFSAFGDGKGLLNSVWINKAPDAKANITLTGDWTALDNGVKEGTKGSGTYLSPDKALLPEMDYTFDYYVEYNSACAGGNPSTIVIGYWRDAMPAYSSPNYNVRWLMADVNGDNAWNVMNSWATGQSGGHVLDGWGDYGYTVPNGCRVLETPYAQAFTRDMSDDLTSSKTVVWDNLTAKVTSNRSATGKGSAAMLLKGRELTGSDGEKKTINNSEYELPFYFFKYSEATVYSFRVYDAVLTTGEMNQNHMVDILAYYSVDVSGLNAFSGLDLTILLGKLSIAFGAATGLNASTAQDLFDEVVGDMKPSPAYTSLYVTDGATMILTAYSEDDNTLDLASHKWINRADGVAIKLYDSYSFRAAMSGTTSASAYNANQSYDLVAGGVWNNTDSALEFGMQYLPDGNYTIESVMLPIGTTVGNDGVSISTNTNTYGVEIGRSFFAGPWKGEGFPGIRLNGGNPVIRDRYSDNELSWMYTEGNNGWSSAQGGYGITQSWALSAAYVKDQGFKAMTYTIDRTTNKSNRDSLTVTSSINGTWSVSKDAYYPNGSGMNFYLNYGMPATFYAVRVYNRTLTAFEKYQNHFADLCGYYDLDCSRLTALSGEEYSKLQLAVAAETGDYGFELDKTLYASTKEELQTIIDNTVVATDFDALDEFYVQEGLVGLFDAYKDAEGNLDVSVDLEKGVWHNKANPFANATLTAHATMPWFAGEMGGIGYNMTAAQFDSYVNAKASGFNGVSLPASLLPAGDFTVESVINLKGLTNADGTQFIQTDNATSHTFGYYNSGAATFQYGIFQSTSFLQRSNIGGTSPQTVRWCISDSAWGGHNGNGKRSGAGTSYDLNKDPENTYTMTVTREKRHSEDTFYSFYQLFLPNGTTSYDQLAMSQVTGSTVNIGWSDTSGNGCFKLLNGIAGKIFAIRVYDRVLTTAERAQNHFIDIAKYVGADAKLVEALSLEQRTVLGTMLINATFQSFTKASFEALIASMDMDKMLYVTDGLVLLLDGYQGGGADVAGGKWYNSAIANLPFDEATLAACGSATFKGNWTKYKNAVGVETSTGFNRATELTLDARMFPEAGDMTIEIISNISAPSSTNENAAVRMGYLVFCYLGTTTTRWYLANNTALATWNGSPAVGSTTFATKNCDWGNNTNDTKFVNFGAVQNYSIIRDEADDKQTATLTFNTNGVKNKGTTLRKDSVTNNGDGTYSYTGTWPYPVEGETSAVSYATIPNFLFNGIPNTTYAIRVYNRLLTAEENAQNHFADVAHYLDLDLTGYYELDDAGKAQARETFKFFSFDSDKDLAQAALDNLSAASYDYSDLYVDDGLQGLFTAFDMSGFTKSGNTITWKNLVDDGTDAILTDNGYYWQPGVNGGIGYSMTKTQWDSDYTKVGLELPAAYAEFEEFTVEAAAAISGLTNPDGTRFYNIGAETRPAGHDRWGVVGGAKYAFRFDVFSGETFVAVNNGNLSGAADSLATRWWFTLRPYSAYNNTANGTTVIGNVCDTHVQVMNLGDIHTLYVTREVDDQSGDITFSTAWNPEANRGGITNTLTADQYAVIKGDTGAKDPSGAMSLFNGYPATVYAIRVYNRLLTDEEKAINHAIDVLGAMGIDPASYRAATPEKKDAVVEALANYTLNSDKTTVTNLVSFLLGDAGSLAESILTVDGFEPVTGGNVPGYRVLFNIDSANVDMYKDYGYDVYYGAIIGLADFNNADFNTVDGLTVKYAGGKITTDCDNAQITLVGGNGGSGLTHTFNGKTQFSAAVMFDNEATYSAGIIVRGFTVAVKDGVVAGICYDTAAFQDEEINSMADVAKYFVNDYTADLGLAYKYMTDAGLLKALVAANVLPRTTLGNVFNIYVDAENGDDAKDGLSEANAVATLAKAVAQAKAILGSEQIAGITVHLSAGLHRVASDLTISASDVTAKQYYLHFVGEGEDTVVTTTQAFEGEEGDEYFEFNVGAGKNFRYIYDEEFNIIPVAHAGDRENFNEAVVVVDDKDNSDTSDDTVIRFDAEGTEKEDQTAEIADTDLVKFFLNPDLFDYESSFAGTELHITTEWNFNIIHIDHVDWDDEENDDGNVAVYFNAKEYFAMALTGGEAGANGRQYWLENAEYFLSTVEEDAYWYDAASGILYVNPATSGAITTIEIPTSDNLLAFDSLKNVTVADLTLTGVDNTYLPADHGYRGGQAGGSAILPNTKGVFLTKAAITVKNAQNLIVTGVKIFNVGGDGINVYGANDGVLIDSNEIAHVGETGIRIGTSSGSWSASNQNKNIVISNNYVHNTGEYFVQCPGILMTIAVNAKIIGNTVVDTTYSAMSIGWRWGEANWTLADLGKGSNISLYNVEIAYNYITDFMTCMRDGAAIYTLGGNARYDQKGALNFMHDNYVVVSGDSGAHGNYNAANNRWCMGYYHDGASSNWYDTNNVVIGAPNVNFGKFIPMYLQSIAGQVSHNITTVGNYGINCSQANTADGFYGGFRRITETVNDLDDHKGTDRGNIANNFIYMSVADLKAGTMLTDNNTTASRMHLDAPVNAANKVAAIFATAGSNLDAVPALSNGNLGVTAEANEKVYVGADEDNVFNTSADDFIDLTGVKFTVTFKYGDTIYDQTQYDIGATIVAPQVTPTKEADAQYTYTFTGWSGFRTGETKANGTYVFEPVFSKTVNQYHVQFFVGDNAVLDGYYDYGTKLATLIPATAEKESDAQYNYVFHNWYDSDSATADQDSIPASAAKYATVTADVAFYAFFKTNACTYKLRVLVGDKDGNPLYKVVDGDGVVSYTTNKDAEGAEIVVLYSKTVEYGKTYQEYPWQITDYTLHYHPNYASHDAGYLKNWADNQVGEVLASFIPAAEPEVTYGYNNEVFVYAGNQDASFYCVRGTTDLGDFLWNLSNCKGNVDFMLKWTKNATPHGITINGVDAGTVKYGESIKSVVEDSIPVGYELDKVTIVGGEEITDLDTYTMPANDLELTVTYTVKKFALTINEGDPTDVEFGASIKALVEATVPAGKKIATVMAGDTPIDLDTYTMPAKAVALTVTYENAGLKGDVNGDQEVNATDTGLILAAIANGTTEDIIAIADINGDGEVNATDTGLILAAIANGTTGEL